MLPAAGAEIANLLKPWQLVVGDDGAPLSEKKTRERVISRRRNRRPLAHDDA
jgi:hypothetical protein